MPKMLFLNIGWMREYKGLKNDNLFGGFAYLKKHKYGHEIYNFLSQNGKCYAYAPIRNINLETLGANNDDTFLKNVIVIFVATRPKKGGTVIVGWYKNATVYRDFKKSKKVYNGKNIWFIAEANYNDIHLLKEDERLFPIKRKQKGSLGQNPAWYPKDVTFINNVVKYVNTGVLPNVKNRKKIINVDSITKRKIEKNAIAMTIEYYQAIGYDVESVEDENKGWDLEAINGKYKLLIEVKGKSADSINIELTPNEYENMNKYFETYRLSVVTNALSKGKIYIFSYSSENNSWKDQNNKMELDVRKVISARITVKE